jgi:hypothetical protein
LTLKTATVNFSDADDLQQAKGSSEFQDEWAAWTQLGPVPLRALGDIPSEYRGAGNVYVAAIGCNRVEPPSLVARLFMRRLNSKLVWDGQVATLRTREELETDYLEDYPLKTTDSLVDEIHRLCAIGDGRRWYDETWKRKAQAGSSQ